MNNSDNKDDCMAATAPGSHAAFPPSMEVRSRGTTPRMGEVEQRMEQLPRAPKVGALGDAGTVAAQLKILLQQIVNSENLDAQRIIIKGIATELGLDILDCAAALVYLNQKTAAIEYGLRQEPQAEKQSLPESSQPSIKMVRYRLDVGRKHRVTLEELKKLLIEESGVDKNNINNIIIQGDYTLIELPDAMPPDIFLHLKSVEINQHKLDIRRVKTRNYKKRGNNNFRRGRQRNAQSDNEGADQVNS